jgi:hypothetical protein
LELITGGYPFYLKADFVEAPIACLPDLTSTAKISRSPLPTGFATDEFTHEVPALMHEKQILLRGVLATFILFTF